MEVKVERTDCVGETKTLGTRDIVDITGRHTRETTGTTPGHTRETIGTNLATLERDNWYNTWPH